MLDGELAQLGERLVCNQEVTGSSPVFSTNVGFRFGLHERESAEIESFGERNGAWPMGHASEASQGVRGKRPEPPKIRGAICPRIKQGFAL